MYLAESLGFKECSSRELEDASFFMKYFVPEKTSFSSLNHFTSRGAEPMKAHLKSAVAPEGASWDCGLTVKDGGSGVVREETDRH